MGVACPVCGTPQADAGHLANHLAITAIARGGDHEAWLDEQVPDWEGLDEAALAERVSEHADQADYPQVFEDTTEGADGPAIDPEAMARRAGDGPSEDDLAEVIARARELARGDSETE